MPNMKYIQFTYTEYNDLRFVKRGKRLLVNWMEATEYLVFG